MKRCLILICVLAGCNTPTAEFYGAETKTVQVDGSTYKVFVKDGRAQAIRTNSELNYRKGAEARVTRAIEQASGCKVSGDLTGDPVLASASLSCRGRPAPPPRPQGFTCEAYDLGRFGTEIACDPR